MHCTLIPGTVHIEGHTCRILEITCPNGYTDSIYVTEEPAFSIKADLLSLNVWHYTISQDGKRISLLGMNGQNSVNFKSIHPDGCHETIIDWELREYQEP